MVLDSGPDELDAVLLRCGLGGGGGGQCEGKNVEIITYLDAIRPIPSKKIIPHTSLIGSKDCRILWLSLKIL